MEPYLELDDILSVEEIAINEVYDIEVDKHHSYYLDCGKPILVHNSSKTWSIFHFFLVKAHQEKISVTIARDKLSWIKSTILLDFKEITEELGITVTPEININRQEQVYMVNGSEFAFNGLDYPEKLHGRKQDWSWINEAMEVDKKSFEQLELRTTKGLILDYNPANDEHWVFDLQKRDDVTTIKSTMLDNPFLEETIKNKIRSYEPTPENIARGTADNYMWEVYGLGNKARLEGVVFNNWDIVEEIPENAKFIGYGMDFGYSNDPTTLVGLYMMDNELYWDEIIYETGLLNTDIVQKLKGLKVLGTEIIYADSAEPKSIEEIRRHGFYIRGADKGQDSIKFGINLLKGYRMHITKRSQNLERELRKYKWAEDKTGRALNVPVDANNHIIDGMRYIAMMKLGKKQGITFFNKAELGI